MPALPVIHKQAGRLHITVPGHACIRMCVACLCAMLVVGLPGMLPVTVTANASMRADNVLLSSSPDSPRHCFAKVGECVPRSLVVKCLSC